MLFELTNVTYRYADGTPALDDVSFSIRSTGVAILGANGSGKSTLLRILSGLHFPSSGVVMFKGEEVSEASLKEQAFRQNFRRSVGFIFQNADSQLFNATVFDEVAFGLRQLGYSEEETQSRTNDTLEFLGIRQLADRAPFRLSGGEKRRVAIASVLSMNPEVLVFDEPFLGLDPRGQTWLTRTILQLQEAGKTTIVATHTLDMVPRIAEQAVVLGENHKLLASGSVADLFEDNNLLLDANLIEDLLETVHR